MTFALKQIAHQREQAHASAKLLFDEGRWTEVIDILEPSLKQTGKNILALCDLTWCYYFLGEMYRWERAVADLETQFLLSRELLSPLSFYNACLNLGKFFEEQGQLTKAQLYYLAPFDSAHHLNLNQRQNSILVAQLLRLSVFLGLSTAVSKWYADLTLRIRSYSDYFFEVEIEHALILGELTLVGTTQALQRYERLAQNRQLSRYDQRLLYFDILEHLLYTGQSLEGLQQRAPVFALDELDQFETALLQIKDGNTTQIPLQRMSLTCGLRILILRLQRQKSHAELKNQIQLLLANLDDKSSHLLYKKWTSILQETRVEISMNEDHHLISMGGRSLNFGKKRLSFKLLQVFGNREEIPLEELVPLVWEAEFNPSYTERARVCIQRLNKDLKSLTALPHTLHFTTDRVTLDPSIQITTPR